MRSTWAKLALAAMMATMAFGPVAITQAQGAPDEVRVDLNLKDADILVATQMLTKTSGLQFVVETGADLFRKVTLSLKGVTAEEALRYICKSAGAYYRRDEAGVYFISDKAFGTDKPAVGGNDTSVPPAIRPLVTKKVKLLKGDSYDVYLRLRGEQPDPNEYVKKVNEFRNVTSRQGVRQIGQGPQLQSPAPYTPMPTQSYNNPTSGMESGNRILLPGEGGGQLAPPSGGGGGGGQLGGGGGQGRQGGGGAPSLQGGTGLVPQGIDHISYDPTDNSLVVRGTEEAIAELQRNIALFDVAPRQVIIKIEFITTSSAISRSLGFDFLFQRGGIFAGNRPGSFARVGDPIFINYATGNITTRLRALLSEGYGKAVQAPVVRTLNNQPASVFQSIQSTIFVNQLISAGNGQIIVVPTAFDLSINTGVQVAPRINDDDTITMFLQPVVEDFGQLRRGPNGEEIPDRLSQQINVVARVRDGETIALGGLTRKQETGSQSRFPILGDLPVIGQFFRATSREVNNQELIIFVTPTIVREDETLGGGGG